MPPAAEVVAGALVAGAVVPFVELAGLVVVGFGDDCDDDGGVTTVPPGPATLVVMLPLSMYTPLK